ncbi:DUF4921 family protein [Candidatus Parcubacteria bacterium]|nr:DUF4921 family protein [Candidatus Parcubacteria bacterium]
MLNEFRQDPVSGDWVLFSTARAKKPGAREQLSFYQDKAECPFEPSKMEKQELPVLVFKDGQEVSKDTPDWTLQVIPNKYPAVTEGTCEPVRKEGLVSVADGKGFHELVITRDHEAHFAQFNREQTEEVLKAYLIRYRTIAASDCGEYISIFHNHGLLAGASIYHNHSQIISMPIVASTLDRHFQGAGDFLKNNGVPIHTKMLEWEIKENKRIVYQNDKFVVLCSYVSRSPYEMRVFPKDFSSDFSLMSDSDVSDCADALNTALKKLFKAVDNPDYTFFIHTAPPHQAHVAHGSYQWHIEIMPRLSIAAGLELGTNVFMNMIDPDEAAKLLRETDV